MRIMMLYCYFGVHYELVLCLSLCLEFIPSREMVHVGEGGHVTGWSRMFL